MQLWIDRNGGGGSRIKTIIAIRTNERQETDDAHNYVLKVNIGNDVLK